MSALALIAALPLAPAAAQVFSLPPGTPTPTPRAPGPVDADNPVVSGPRPTPTAATPTPTPPPASTPSATPSAAPTSTAPRAAQPRPRPTAASPTASAPPPATTAVGIEPLPTTSALPLPTVAPPSAAPSLTTQPDTEPATWPWYAGGAALLLALGGGAMWWRRRREVADADVEFEPPIVAAPAPRPEPAPPAPPPLPEPTFASVPASGLGVELEATRLSATLLNTTLLYRLRLTNHGTAPLGPLAVSGDMVAAHASLPVEQQLGLDGRALEPRHQLPGLAPGESVLLIGDIRLPLAAITPIRAGTAAFFVPLARFRVEAATGSSTPLVETHAFVVGETPEIADAALRPFRLDLGPRVYSRIGQREVGIAAGIPA